MLLQDCTSPFHIAPPSLWLYFIRSLRVAPSGILLYPKTCSTTTVFTCCSPALAVLQQYYTWCSSSTMALLHQYVTFFSSSSISVLQQYYTWCSSSTMAVIHQYFKFFLQHYCCTTVVFFRIPNESKI